MTSTLLRALERALAVPAAPRADEQVLVAVSGGPDSTALAAALRELCPSHDLRIAIAHVDHGLRAAESDGDREAVEALATRLGIPCIVATAIVGPGPNLEARARKARHRALTDVARTIGASAIALAHTMDDQVETVLLRLLRGTGRGGLGGMHPRRGGLWRPLLEVTRTDVRRYLADRALSFRLDRSNASLAHTRNRLRRLVVPLLMRELNPRLGASVSALAARLRDEDAVLDALAHERLAAHARADALAIEVGGEPPALARRIVRLWLDHLGDHATNARHIDRVVALARGSTRERVAIPGPARVVREGDALVRKGGRQARREAFRHDVIPGVPVQGPGGAWRLHISGIRERTQGDPGLGSARQACFDADTMHLPLVVRSVAPGDRIVVPGVGTRKLQDVLVDAKVPREQRARVPLLADALGRVLWVAGIVRGAHAMVTPATLRVVDGCFE